MRKEICFSTLPKNYGALVALFPPRPIHDRVAYDSTVEVVDAALVEEHELTVAALGKVIGVDGSHAAKILRGDRSITATHPRKLARHFAVSVEALLGQVQARGRKVVGHKEAQKDTRTESSGSDSFLWFLVPFPDRA